jgi:hypothetical protein
MQLVAQAVASGKKHKKTGKNQPEGGSLPAPRARREWNGILRKHGL